MQIINILISVVRNKLTVMFIGAAGLGFADLLSRSAEFLGHFSQCGLNISGVRRISQIYEQEGHSENLLQSIATLRTWVFLLAMLGMCLTVLVSPLIAHFLLDDQGDYTTCLALAPLVALCTLLGGEATILKATHQLKKLALCTAGGAFTTLCVAAILYPTMGISGVLPVLIFSILSLFGIHLYATTRHYPYRLRINREGIRDGLPIIRLGISFAFTGVIASGAEVFVRYFIKSQASDAEVGFYAAAFTLVVSYSRIIFAAVDADYYPRLSAIVENQQEMNTIVNRQINALVMLMTPFLIGFSIALPFIVVVLYSEEFLCVIPMVLAALNYMFFKAVYTPTAMLALAKGDAKIFLLMETLYNLVFVLAVSIGYAQNGLLGAGIGLTIANLYDLIAINIVYSYRYGYVIDRKTLLHTMIQFALLAVVLFLCFTHSNWVKYGFGTLFFIMSCCLSYHTYRIQKN